MNSQHSNIKPVKMFPLRGEKSHFVAANTEINSCPGQNVEFLFAHS